MLRLPGSNSVVAMALRHCRKAFLSVAVFSGGVNLLMLAGPLYMLQVYDRVLAARSVPTLVALTVFLIGAYAFQGALDIIRSRIVVRIGALLDRQLGPSIHDSVVKIANRSANARDPIQPVRDLDQIRSFFSGAGPIAIVDIPWMPFFLGICFLLHPWLGMTALAGGAILLGLTFLTEFSSLAPASEFSKLAGQRGAMVESDRRNSESIVAMGMATTLGDRWMAVNERYLNSMGRFSDVAGTYGSLSKIIRMLLQSAILGIGALLVIRGEMTAGAMIAASIMMGRALAPIETIIANWRGFVAARQSVRRLKETLDKTISSVTSTVLPKPSKSFEVERLMVVAPGGQSAIVRDVRFRLEAGEALGIVGPSGAGKTTLVRALTGIWPAAQGAVRIDGAKIDQWDPVFLGKSIGFVSQNVELFDGTIAENISRMMPQADSELVLEAARSAGAHDMILQMPKGYDTPIGEGGAVLSGGQRQRIALARALFGQPFLIVLDEPSSNLDAEGESALLQAIKSAKQRGAIVMLVAHRPSALAECDKVLFMANGTQQAFGARDEVLKKITAQPPAPRPQVVTTTPAGLKVVREGSVDNR